MDTSPARNEQTHRARSRTTSGLDDGSAVPPEIRRTVADREVDEATVDLARQQEPVQAATSPSPGETRRQARHPRLRNPR